MIETDKATQRNLIRNAELIKILTKVFDDSPVFFSVFNSWNYRCNHCGEETGGNPKDIKHKFDCITLKIPGLIKQLKTELIMGK